MKNSIRYMLRVLLKEKRKKRWESQPLVYSASGFLTDLLEQNGFYVRKLACYNGKSFNLDVELYANEDMFRDRLKRIARTTAIKF